MNLYAYVHSSPLRLTDPKGLDAFCGSGARFVPKPGTTVWDRQGSCVPDPNDGGRDCPTGDCNFFPPTTNDQSNTCRYECNLRNQPICTGIATTAGLAAGPEAAGPAGGVCIIAKMMICELKCQIQECATDKPPPIISSPPRGQCSTGSTDCLLYGANRH